MSDKLGDMLLQSKLISEKQLASALEYQQEIGGKLGVILVKLNFIKEDSLADFLSQQLKVEIVHLKDRKLDASLMKLVPREFAEKHELLPLSKDGNVLTVVTPDPTDYPSIDELAFTTGMKIQTVLATRSEVVKALQKFYYQKGKPEQGGTSTPTEPISAPAPVTGPSGIAAAKRGRGAHVAPVLGVDQQAPLEARPINVDPDKLVRAVTGLLVEKNVISLSELMDRVARES